MKTPLKIDGVEPHYYEILDADGVVVHKFETDDAAQDAARAEVEIWDQIIKEINEGDLKNLFKDRFNVLWANYNWVG